MYITAWKQFEFGEELLWPEREDVALRFVLDHARDLREITADDPTRDVIEALIAMELRKTRACPFHTRSAHCILARVSFHDEPCQPV